MLASVTRKSSASSTRPSAGTRLPADEEDHVARHDLVHGHRPFDAVAKDPAGQGQPLLELLDRIRRTILLEEAEKRAAEHDREDDRCVDPLPEGERHQRREDQDDDKGTLELAGQEPERPEPSRCHDPVGADFSRMASACSVESPPGPDPSSAATARAARFQ